MAFAAIALGLAIGLSIGLLGGGGSVLAVPVLVYLLGQDVHEATTASLVVVTAAAVAGGLGHAREGRVCWRHAVTFAAAALPGVAVGTVLGERVDGDVLIAGFAVLMLLAAVATWRRAGDGAEEGDPEPACPPLRVARDLAAGVVIGAMTGFFGVGGGFLIVPTLATVLALSMRLAVGTSLAIVTATSLMALGAHLVAGREIETGVTLVLTLAAIGGALGGARLAQRISSERLGHAFAVLVVVIAGYLLVSAAWLGGPPA